MSSVSVCEAKDPKARPRAIKSHNDREVFTGGSLAEADGDYWLELGPRIPVQQARLVST